MAARHFCWGCFGGSVILLSFDGCCPTDVYGRSVNEWGAPKSGDFGYEWATLAYDAFAFFRIESATESMMAFRSWVAA